MRPDWSKAWSEGRNERVLGHMTLPNKARKGENMGTLKNWRKLPLHGFMLVFCLSLIGCGTHRLYKGPGLPTEKVAHFTNEGNKSIRLLAVDGKYGPHEKFMGTVQSLTVFSMWKYFPESTLLPYWYIGFYFRTI